MIELTNEQRYDFFQVGFFVLSDFFKQNEIDEMKISFQSLQETAFSLANKHLDELGQEKETYVMYQGAQFVLGRVKRGVNSGQPSIRRVAWCGAAEPMLSKYGEDQRLLYIASQLLGSKEMSQLINQAHFKLPGDEVTFEWHQDSTHRGYGSNYWQDINGQGSYVQIITAIDDMTEKNGPVCFIPNTVKLGHLDLPKKLGQCLHAGIFRLEDAVPVEMPAGSIAVFHPYSIHSSQPNRSNNTRHVFINGYACLGANSRQYAGEGSGKTVVCEYDVVTTTTG